MSTFRFRAGRRCHWSLESTQQALSFIKKISYYPSCHSAWLIDQKPMIGLIFHYQLLKNWVFLVFCFTMLNIYFEKIWNESMYIVQYYCTLQIIWSCWHFELSLKTKIEKSNQNNYISNILFPGLCALIMIKVAITVLHFRNWMISVF